MDADAPMVVRWSGLYFYGTSIMHISPYDGSTAESVFNQKHTVGMFIKRDVSANSK
jgi:hypothetical protein